MPSLALSSNGARESNIEVGTGGIGGHVPQDLEINKGVGTCPQDLAINKEVSFLFF